MILLLLYHLSNVLQLLKNRQHPRSNYDLVTSFRDTDAWLSFDFDTSSKL